MIPKIIHQIWVGDFKIPNRELNLIKKTAKINSSFEHIFWTEAPKLPDIIQERYDRFFSEKQYAMCADLLRLHVITQYGGFYLDVDFDFKESLDIFTKYDGVLLYHNDTDMTIPNNVFGMKKNSEVMNFFVDSVKPECDWFGPTWFGKTLKEYFQLPYDTEHTLVQKNLQAKNIEYFHYNTFENTYAKHLSLYSWSPAIWTKLSNKEQL